MQLLEYVTNSYTVMLHVVLQITQVKLETLRNKTKKLMEFIKKKLMVLVNPNVVQFNSAFAHIVSPTIFKGNNQRHNIQPKYKYQDVLLQHTTLNPPI
jgi:hypothetical protein